MKIKLLVFSLVITAGSLNAQQTGYTLSDTLEFSNSITSGMARILKLGELTIDTVDNAFGIKEIGGTSVAYHKVLVYGRPGPDGSYQGRFDSYILFKSGEKMFLKNMLENFDDWFSSPAVINGYFLYWGIKRENKSKYMTVYAMRFDLNRNRTDSIFLYSDFIKTDDPGYFYRPVEDFGGYRFESASKSWLVEESFARKQLVK